MSNVFDDIIAKDPERAPPPPPSGNPYPPGSEEADWYDRQPKAQAPRAETYRDPGGYTDQGVPIGGPSVFGDLPSAGFTPPAPRPRTEYRGSMLPIARDTAGNLSFDPLGSGPIGSMIEGAKVPGRVLAGDLKVDPADPNFMGQVLNMAGNYGVRANPMVKSGDYGVPGVKMGPRDPRAAAAQTPSVELLKDVGGDQMDAFRSMNIPYNPAFIGRNLHQQLTDEMLKIGAMPEHAKGLYKTVDRLRDYIPRSDDPTATIHATPASLMAIRDAIKKHFDNPKENKAAVGAVYRAFDRFLENPPPEALLARGTPASRASRDVGFAGQKPHRPTIEDQIAATAGADIFKRGRANYSAGFRGEDLSDIAEAAGLRNWSSNSGNNLGNSVRSRVTSALLNDKRMVGFNEPEVAALRAVPEGSRKQNIQRYVGNILGGGGGIGTQAVGWGAGGLMDYLGLGPGISTAAGFGIPALGYAIKNRAGQSTLQSLEDVNAMTRQRSPLFQETPFKERVLDPTVTLTPSERILRRGAQAATQGGQGVPLDPEDYRELMRQRRR